MNTIQVPQSIVSGKGFRDLSVYKASNEPDKLNFPLDIRETIASIGSTYSTDDGVQEVVKRFNERLREMDEDKLKFVNNFSDSQTRQFTTLNYANAGAISIIMKQQLESYEKLFNTGCNLFDEGLTPRIGITYIEKGVDGTYKAAEKIPINIIRTISLTSPVEELMSIKKHSQVCIIRHNLHSDGEATSYGCVKLNPEILDDSFLSSIIFTHENAHNELRSVFPSETEGLLIGNASLEEELEDNPAILMREAYCNLASLNVVIGSINAVIKATGKDDALSYRNDPVVKEVLKDTDDDLQNSERNASKLNEDGVLLLQRMQEANKDVKEWFAEFDRLAA